MAQIHIQYKYIIPNPKCKRQIQNANANIRCKWKTNRNTNIIIGWFAICWKCGRVAQKRHRRVAQFCVCDHNKSDSTPGILLLVIKVFLVIKLIQRKMFKIMFCFPVGNKIFYPLWTESLWQISWIFLVTFYGLLISNY